MRAAALALAVAVAWPATAGLRRPLPSRVELAAEAWCAAHDGVERSWARLRVSPTGVRVGYLRFECGDGRRAFAFHPGQPPPVSAPNCASFAFCAMATTACDPEPVVLAMPGISFTCADGVHLIAGWWGRGYGRPESSPYANRWEN